MLGASTSSIKIAPRVASLDPPSARRRGGGGMPPAAALGPEAPLPLSDAAMADGQRSIDRAIAAADASLLGLYGRSGGIGGGGGAPNGRSQLRFELSRSAAAASARQPSLSPRRRGLGGSAAAEQSATPRRLPPLLAAARDVEGYKGGAKAVPSPPPPAVPSASGVYSARSGAKAITTPAAASLSASTFALPPPSGAVSPAAGLQPLSIGAVGDGSHSGFLSDGEALIADACGQLEALAFSASSFSSPSSSPSLGTDAAVVTLVIPTREAFARLDGAGVITLVAEGLERHSGVSLRLLCEPSPSVAGDDGSADDGPVSVRFIVAPSSTDGSCASVGHLSDPSALAVLRSRAEAHLRRGLKQRFGCRDTPL